MLEGRALASRAGVCTACWAPAIVPRGAIFGERETRGEVCWKSLVWLGLELPVLWVVCALLQRMEISVCGAARNKALESRFWMADTESSDTSLPTSSWCNRRKLKRGITHV